jgi:mono/diheme cytochrome c family protein
MIDGSSTRRTASAAFAFLTLVSLFASASGAQAADGERWKKRFAEDILPILKSRCVECHGAEEPDGGLDLVKFVDGADPLAAIDVWERVGPRIRQNEMPPEGSPGLNDDQKGKFNGWLDARPQADNCHQLASDETTSWYRGYVMSRRLTRTEFGNAVRDLFGVDLDADADVPSDGAGGEGFDTAGDALFTSPIHLEKYVAAADRVVRTVLPDDTNGLSPEVVAARERLLIASPSDSLSPRDAAKQVLSTYVKRAWRRPVEAEEIERLLVLFDQATERGEPFEKALRQPLAAAMLSPHFLFVVETEPEEGGVHRLSPHQLAMRVSLFLWSSIPDDRLLELADAGAIYDEATLRDEVRRMAADPKARALGENFGMQWLGLTALGESTKPDAEKFPEFDAELSAAMREEPIRLMQRVFAENRSLLELIDADYVPANGRLARHYGLEPTADEDWSYVSASGGRGGVVTTAAVLASTSYPLRTSPVLRGRWALETLLGSKVPPPPPGVPALEATKAEGDKALSLRERLELHRKDPNCASCHARMDPLGFGLENYDPLGRWRTEDDGIAIDASGKLPSGETFTGPDELKTLLLKRKDEFLKHFVRKTLGFALGRDLNRFDDCVVDAAMKRLNEEDYKAQGLLEEIVLSYPFQHRYFKSK